MQNNYGHSLTRMLKTIEKLQSLMQHNMVIGLLSNVENKEKRSQLAAKKRHGHSITPMLKIYKSSQFDANKLWS